MAGSIDFTIPATAPLGSIMLAFCAAGHANNFGGNSGINPPVVVPAWTQTPSGLASIDLGGGGGIRFRVFVKEVVAGDPGSVASFSWVDPTDSAFAGHLEVYTDVDTVAPIIDDDVIVEAPESPLVIDAPGLTPNPARLPERMVVLHLADAQAPEGPWSVPAGMTERGEISTIGAGAAPLTVQVCDQNIPGPGFTGDKTATFVPGVAIGGIGYSCLLNPACAT